MFSKPRHPMDSIAVSTRDLPQTTIAYLKEVSRKIVSARSSARMSKVKDRFKSAALRPAHNLLRASAIYLGSAANYLMSASLSLQPEDANLRVMLRRSAKWLGKASNLLISSKASIRRAIRLTSVAFKWATASFNEGGSKPYLYNGGRGQLKLTNRLCHILVKHRHCRRPVDHLRLPVYRGRSAAKKLAKCLQSLVSTGAYSFDDLLISFSECLSKFNQGFIDGRYRPSNMSQAFNDSVSGLSPGNASDVLETNSGFHILYYRSAHKTNLFAPPVNTGEKICHILLKHKDSVVAMNSVDLPVSRTKKELLQTVKTLHHLLINGLITFSQLAHLYTDCLSFPDRELIHNQYLGNILMESFGKLPWDFEPGEFSKVIESPYGYHLLFLCSSRPQRGNNEPGFHRRCDFICEAGDDVNVAALDVAALDVADLDVVDADVADVDVVDLDAADEDVADVDVADVNVADLDVADVDAANPLVARKIGHILIKYRDSVPSVTGLNFHLDRSKEHAKKYLLDIRDEIATSCITFSEAAIIHSECLCCQNNGIIKRRYIGMMMEPFKTVALSLAPKQMSGIIENEHGLHILRRFK